MICIHHDARDAELLVNAANHDLFIDRLVIAADEVAIEVDIKVIQRATARQRDIGVDVVHIKRVRGQGYSPIA